MDDSTYPEHSAAEPVLDVIGTQERLATLHLGHPFLYYPAIDSTNSRAAELAREGAGDGTLIITDYQTGGRGRLGRPWRAFPGRVLTFSLVLRPRFPAHYLVMASAIAVCVGIEQVTGLSPTIKWPNDVLLRERKVCGILIESTGEYVILGIGLNVNGTFAGDPDLAARAITIQQAAGHEVKREELLGAVLAELDGLYAQLQRDGDSARTNIRDIWSARLSTLGKHVTITQGERLIQGLAEDIDDDGTLLVRVESGKLETITWGDVNL